MVTRTETVTLRVLVVDDDEALRRMLRLSLDSAGFQVSTAEDGLVGLDRLDAGEYNVIVLDLQMPRMDGRTFFREMRVRGHGAKVVVLSAYGAEQARLELGAEAAIPKPFDPDVLVETITSLGEQS